MKRWVGQPVKWKQRVTEAKVGLPIEFCEDRGMWQLYLHVARGTEVSEHEDVKHSNL